MINIHTKMRTGDSTTIPQKAAIISISLFMKRPKEFIASEYSTRVLFSTGCALFITKYPRTIVRTQLSSHYYFLHYFFNNKGKGTKICVEYNEKNIIFALY